MSNIFSKVPIKLPKRNVFDLSYENRFSCKMGELIPFFCKPVVPGDTFKVNTEIFIRTAPLVSPMFQKINVYTHYFYVPNRLIMKEWEQFISPHGTASEPEPQEKQLPCLTGLIDPLSSNDSCMWASVLGVEDGHSLVESDFNGTLFDFLGYKFSNVNLTNHRTLQSLLPINAYNLIFHEYYRDQNVGNASTIDDCVLLDASQIYDIDWDTISRDYETQSGEAINKYFNIRRRCWKKDYFTSALPFTQRGGDVHIPLYGSAPVIGSNSIASQENTPYHPKFAMDVDNNSSPKFSYVGDASDRNYALKGQSGSELNSVDMEHHHYVSTSAIASQLSVDLSNVTAATINELRRAVQLQKYLEISARVGGRYKEFVLGHFGVDINDGRLQRPEYLGGGVSPLTIGDVFQTSSTVTSEQNTYALGDLAGRGSSYGNQQGFKHTFPEHGYVIGILSIQPEAAYYQGVPRDLLKMDRLDFYTPEFAHLGEQGIYNAELYKTINDTDSEKDYETFGYSPRYSEYKFSLGEIHGSFKDSLDTWHDARKFDIRPTLSQEFLQVSEFSDGLNRVFAVPGTVKTPVEHFYCFVNHHVKALRPMPVFGIPKF